jgi:hypothetical protein
MTRIGTPNPGIVATPLPQGAPTAALLAELPATLNNVALGTFLTGTVLDRAANGLTLLQTASGLLGLKTTVPLPPGATVTLQIQTAGAQLQAIVLSVTPAAQGQAAPQTAPTNPQPAGVTGHTPAPATSNNSVAPQPAAPSTITATVIGPAGGPVPASVSAGLSTPQITVAPAPQGTATPALPQAVAPATGTPVIASSTSTQAASLPGSAATPAAPEQAAQAAAQPAPLTIPAAAQAAYQRQLNAVPAPPLPTTPQPSPGPTPTAQPAALAQETTATAKPLMPDVAPPPLPTGAQIQVRLLPTLQPNTPALLPQSTDAHAETMAAIVRQTAAQSAHPNAVIMATVVARTPAGQVILDSAVGRLLAPLPRDGEATAPGARLFLELVGGERLAAAPRPAPANAGIASLARNWSNLKDAMRQLQDAPAQQDAYAALERAVPKPGPRLAQQMLSYLENAQNGAKAWLGETVARALGNAPGKVLEQLERDMREMQHARHAAEGDWRMTLVPLLDGNQLRQIRFFERRRKREEAKRRKDEPGRFVVECEHSEHGTLQLDGLMHEQRLDLIVRSHEPLPTEMERDILVLFGETCTGLNLNGQLFFQAVANFPVNPLDDVAKEPVRVSV